MRVVLGLVTIGTIFSTSCLEATEVDVTITTDLRCSSEESGMYELDRTDVQVLVEGMPRSVGTKDGCSNKRVGNIVFVPGGSNEVRLHVVGAVRNQADPVTADRILRFLPHQSLKLDVELSSACVGVKCDSEHTCIRGTCEPIPRIGPPPDDGGLPPIDASNPPDASISLDGGPSDAPSDGFVLGDGPVTLDGSVDAGKCPGTPFPNTTDVHWGFNEGLNMTTIRDDSMMNQVNLIANVKLVNNPPCGTALSFAGTAPQGLATTSWHPTPTLRIAFDFQFVSGFGTILERNPGQVGGWRFNTANGKFAFAVWDDQKMNATLSLALGMGWTRIIGEFAQGMQKLSAYSTNGSQPVTLTLGGYNSDIMVGSSTVQFVMDELWLGR